MFLDHATGIIIGAFAVIGDEVTIMQNVTIGRKQAMPGRAPRIGRGVLLSSGATILGDISIGDFAKIGAGSVVEHDVPAGCTAVGVPARLTNCPEPDCRPDRSPAFQTVRLPSDLPDVATSKACDKLARRANHQKSVQPFARKYSACAVGQIRLYTPAILSRQRGVGHRHERGAGSGGRGGCD